MKYDENHRLSEHFGQIRGRGAKTPSEATPPPMCGTSKSGASRPVVLYGALLSYHIIILLYYYLIILLYYYLIILLSYYIIISENIISLNSGQKPT